jgi:hypothetical protein
MMKKLLGVAFLLLVCYIVFFDLSHGTLPAANEKKVETIIKETNTVDIAFFEEKVKAGDTVLTIVENKLKAQIPVSIDEIVHDFGELNDGITPEKIQIGKTYRFPVYSLQ